MSRSASVAPPRVARHPERIGHVGQRHRMVEVHRAPEAETHLVGHADQQEEGEEQVRLLEEVEARQPHQHVGMEQQQAQVHALEAVVSVAQCRPGQHRVEQVAAHEQRQLRRGEQGLPARVLQQRDHADDQEADHAHRRDLRGVQAPGAVGLLPRQERGVEREAGLEGVGLGHVHENALAKFAAMVRLYGGGRGHEACPPLRRWRAGRCCARPPWLHRAPRRRGPAAPRAQAVRRRRRRCRRWCSPAAPSRWPARTAARSPR